MQEKRDKSTEPADGRPDASHRSVVADLTSLVGRVQASLALVEMTIAREAAVAEEPADVFVLDDLTLPYEKAHAALKMSDERLTAALHFLRNAGTA
jgi:hypothetical protein